jgi:uridine kinase
MKPILVGVAGGSASGKTSVCEIVFEELGVKECTLLSIDNFYKECTPEQMKNISKYNFDHPDAFDWELMKDTLEKLMKF